MNFSEIAERYNPIVQTSAGEKLLRLLNINKNEDVLDLGCGIGKLTAKIRRLTKGKVVGIDSSEDMIEKARRNTNAKFIVKAAEEMDFHEEFDVIFCNSAFQWFNPSKALERCFKALKPGGRIGVQAPAKENYCPNFVKAFEEVKKSIKVFANFKSPWFFLETEEEYTKLFEKYGFKVVYCKIEETKSYHTPDEVYRIFESGAIAGYLNPKCYDVDITKHAEAFKDAIRRAFEKQAKNGIVELVFNRVYLIAIKG